MIRIGAIAAAWLAFASSASAVSLTVVPDKLTYALGETIVLTVTGDPEGAGDVEIYGRLLYSAALTDTLTSSQTQHTRAGGAIFALTGVLFRGDGFADVFNQLPGIGAVPRTVDQIQIATATLTADALGVVDVFWSDELGSALDFFGLTNASLGSPPNPVASFTIVPEPAALALLSLGLVAVAIHRRR